MKSLLIKDTTREERMQIVQAALAWGDDCDSVSGMSNSVDAMYQPYIDGILELAEINMLHAATRYTHG